MQTMSNEDMEKLLAQHQATPKLTANTGNFYQPIVVYNRKVKTYKDTVTKTIFDELQIEKKVFKKIPNVITHEEVFPVETEEESVPFIFYSDMIFTSATEAGNFLGLYIKKLIDNKDLPEDVLNEDRTPNEDFIKPAVIKLQLGQEVRDL